MRNPARIKRILEKIEIIWESKPDLRMNQLIYNLCRNELALNGDLFNLEDEKFEKILDEKIEMIKSNK